MPFLKKRRTGYDEEELPMASMVDIIFLLLIFFISVTKFKVLETELKVTVPAPVKQTKQQGKPLVQEIVIEVKPQKILVNGTRWTLEEVEQKLNAIAKINKGQRIIILGDKRALHEEMINVVNICSKADLLNISLAMPD